MNTPKRIFYAATLAALLSTPALADAFMRGNWAVNSSPAVNTQASAVKAANSGTTHIATTCSGSIATVAAQTTITLALRDGASGAGTVMWSQTVACGIGQLCAVSSPNLNVPGTISVAMTCEWSAAPTTNNTAASTLTGYDIR